MAKPYPPIRYMHQDDPSFWCIMGRFFADSDLRRQLGGPLSSTPEYHWLVSMDGDTVAGFSAIQIRPSGKCEFRHAYVLPDYRNRGINERMIELRIALAVKQGGTQILAIVDPKRKAKYARHGFTEYGTRGKWQVMRKLL